MTARISENISEKRGRGRPRLMSPEMEQWLASEHRHVKTARGRQNIYYAHFAARFLISDPRFAWIASDERFRPTILNELGRLGSVEEIQEAAQCVCECKLKTGAALKLIRDYRRSTRNARKPP